MTGSFFRASVSCRRAATSRTCSLVCGLVLLAVLGPGRTLAEWQTHYIRQGDGQDGWIMRPALRQVVKHPDTTYNMPVALVEMDNGEIALLCSREKSHVDGTRTFEPIIAFSKDAGATWSDFMIVPGTMGRPQYLEWLGGGRLSFITEVFNNAGKPQRIFSLDSFDFLRADGYWVDGVCGHIGSVALRDGHVISAYGHYQLGATVLIKWKPDAEPAVAVPRIGIQIGPQANDLERYAADELAGYLRKLFRVDAKPATEPPAGADWILLVGTPQTNPAVAQALGSDGWPQVSEQGIVLKHARIHDHPALVIGGGSPAATLWAVYELVERWGVRYLLHGDVLPENAAPFALPKTDVVLEPNLRVRQWRTVNDFACGPESWGLEEQRRVIDQLAKLRFNRLFISVWSYQPFLDLQIKGVQRTSACLWYDFHYPITDDMPGRQIFGAEPEFWNPDLPRGASYKELSAAGERLIQGILAHAKSRGMQCAMDAILTEFPPEFAPLLPDTEKVQQLGAMSVVPGPKTSVDDPAVSDLATAVLQTTVNTYPDVDYVLLGMPEFRQWAGECERAWQTLDRKYHLEEKVKLADVLAAAGRRTGYPGGAERAMQEAKGDIVLLYFYDRLLTDLRALEGTSRPGVKIIINSAAEELFPILPRVLPPGSETLNFVDYTPTRILRRREVLAQIPARDLPTSLIYTLHDDNVGPLPQLATGSLHEITQDIRLHGWTGLSTRYWLIGDHDPCVSYLARTAWDAATTPESVYRDQIRATCGDACVDDLLTVFREVEQATVQLEWHGLGFGFPVPGMITKHWTPETLPAELASVRGNYERALAAARQTRAKSVPRGRPFVDYWIGRLEFGIGYFDAVAAVRLAARAEADGKRDESCQHAEAAVQHVRTAVEAYARVAGDQSDRGAIAILAEYVYRPLVEKVEQLRNRERWKGNAVP